jgi:signal transduction histidine kinase/ligand-binding sensor domain-containing protein
LLALASAAAADRLPLTTYTTRDGLASDTVSAAVEDDLGFVWFATSRGLSRFDGIGFRNFGRDHGLVGGLYSLAATPDGTLWAGGQARVYRFDPEGGGRFHTVPMEGASDLNDVVRLTVDRKGRVWAGFDALYQLESDGAGIRFRRVAPGPGVSLPFVRGLHADRAGNLWIGSDELYRFTAAGTFARVPLGGKVHETAVYAITEDPAGNVWVADGMWLWRIASGRAPAALRLVAELASTVALAPRPEGGVWVGAGQELTMVDAECAVLRRWHRDNGLGPAVRPLLLDSGGLWLGLPDSGVQRLTLAGFRTFGPAEGLHETRIAALVRTRSGDLVAGINTHTLYRFDGQRFQATRVKLPRGFWNQGWGWHQWHMEDREGAWWIPTGHGIVRFPPVPSLDDLAHVPPRAVYANSGCYRGAEAFRLYEDSRGDVWASTFDARQPIMRWDRRSDTFECYDTSFLGRNEAASAFLDTERGDLWVGFYGGSLARRRRDRFECVHGCEGQRGPVGAMLLDRRGRLWAPVAGAGVLRSDNPGAESPRFTQLTVRDGLSSDHASVVLEDRRGRIWIGTMDGVDVLDDPSNRIVHFGTAEGLPHPAVGVGYADPEGDLWFGTLDGLARLTPPATLPDTPQPRVRIDGVRISGSALPVSVRGQARLQDIVVQPDQREIQIDFLALPASSAPRARYQHRLGSGSWSPPTAQRSLILAGLSPGTHALSIRAVDPAGKPSPDSAFVSLRVLAPFYRRGWFIASAAASILVALLLVVRLRVRHRLAIERQRTRIAMDLHDEMGSSLGSIGVLADLAADPSVEGNERQEILERVARTTSEMGSKLHDIVSSLRAREEQGLADLARLLTERGRRLFPGHEPLLETVFPERWPPTPLSLELQRNLLLVAVEALHNAAKHAAAHHVRLELLPDGQSRWRLTVTDDGRGMDVTSHGNGFGLETMRRRAAEIGATLEIDSSGSSEGTGTRVTLHFDLRPRRGHPR